MSIQDLLDKLANMTLEQKAKLADNFITRYLEREERFAKEAHKRRITNEFLNREYDI